ncbi:MAG: hypothetical protein VB957_17055 [Pseudomonadales bacterium]
MISKILKWSLILVGTVVVTIGLFFGYMRFHDGPMEIIAGGPFTTGELAIGDEPDWSFIKDRLTVEFQLYEPETSRTIWIAVDENKLYLISGYMKTGFGKIWKQWPHYVEKDNRALLRVDGKIYERKLIRLGADDLNDKIISEFNRKYKTGLSREGIASNSAWLYELAPR